MFDGYTVPALRAADRSARSIWPAGSRDTSPTSLPAWPARPPTNGSSRRGWSGAVQGMSSIISEQSRILGGSRTSLASSSGGATPPEAGPQGWSSASSRSLPFFDRSGSVHAARLKQQGRRFPLFSFETLHLDPSSACVGVLRRVDPTHPLPTCHRGDLAPQGLDLLRGSDQGCREILGHSWLGESFVTSMSRVAVSPALTPAARCNVSSTLIQWPDSPSGSSTVWNSTPLIVPWTATCPREGRWLLAVAGTPTGWSRVDRGKRGVEANGRSLCALSQRRLILPSAISGHGTPVATPSSGASALHSRARVPRRDQATLPGRGRGPNDPAVRSTRTGTGYGSEPHGGWLHSRWRGRSQRPTKAIGPSRRETVVVNPLGLLRQGPPRLLWLGQVASVAGDRLYGVAVVWFTVQLTGSAAAVAVITLADTVPFLAVSLLAGAVADMRDGLRLARTVDLIRAGVVAVLPVMYYAWKVLHLIGLAIVAAVLSSMGAFFPPALQASLPRWSSQPG